MLQNRNEMFWVSCQLTAEARLGRLCVEVLRLLFHSQKPAALDALCCVLPHQQAVHGHNSPAPCSCLQAHCGPQLAGVTEP